MGGPELVRPRPTRPGGTRVPCLFGPSSPPDATKGPRRAPSRNALVGQLRASAESTDRLRSAGRTGPSAGDPYPGEENVLRHLRKLAQIRGIGDQVTFLGYVADIEGLLDRVGIFVLPSVRPEPFGLALLEAGGRGLPCIATDAGGPRDMIEHGRIGLLVPPRDPNALADAIEQLWRNPGLRTTLAQAAAADVRERFSIQTTAQQVSALYDELLDGRSRRTNHRTGQVP